LSAGEDVQDDHRCATVRTDEGRRDVGGGFRRRRCGRAVDEVQQFARLGELLAAAGIGEQAVVPDAVEAAGQNVQQEAAHKLTSGRAGALFVAQSSFAFGERVPLVEMATRTRLPNSFHFREAVEPGGLMSYGANVAALFYRAAAYVDKILRGARPADLPVELPDKFELVINLKSAKTLGIAAPPSIKLRADEVIE
jgi:ABC-type uncharacterized transport system substrate-binding protein